MKLLDGLPDDAWLLVLQQLPIKSLVACGQRSTTARRSALSNTSPRGTSRAWTPSIQPSMSSLAATRTTPSSTAKWAATYANQASPQTPLSPRSDRPLRTDSMYWVTPKFVQSSVLLDRTGGAISCSMGMGHLLLLCALQFLVHYTCYLIVLLVTRN